MIEYLNELIFRSSIYSQILRTKNFFALITRLIFHNFVPPLFLLPYLKKKREKEKRKERESGIAKGSWRRELIVARSRFIIISITSETGARSTLSIGLRRFPLLRRNTALPLPSASRPGTLENRQHIAHA